jgi:RNA 2',3'-cyclic 3'-phosphodiesterase
MRPGKRLFVGVRTSVATANTLAGCAETLARRARDARVDLRWVAPTQYHVTLAFLGWTGEDVIGAVCDVLGRAAQAADRLTFRTTRLGAFPSLDQASVLWAGVDEAVAEGMAGLGFAREGRPFHPHVTLARLREPRAIREVVLPMAEQMFGDTRIDAITLFESETKPSGSVHKELAKLPLGRARLEEKPAEKRQTAALERSAPEREPVVGDELLTQTDDGWPRGQGPTDPDTRST